MSDHDHDQDPDDDLRLARLLTDAVSDVEPHERLDEIRGRTAAPAGRLRWYAAGGAAALAAAAVVVAVAVLGNGSATTADPDPLSSPSAPVASDPVTPTVPTQSTPYTLYFVGDTPRGPRLYSEVHLRQGSRDLLTTLQALGRGAYDPDYHRSWFEDAFVAAGFDGVGADGQISVTLCCASLRERPDAMSEEEAQMAVESVIWTLQSALSTSGEPVRAPVQFYLGDNPIDQVYGVPTSEPLANGSSNDVLSQMSITSPTEGQPVSGSFVAEGLNNGFEATAAWQVVDSAGSVVLEYSTMASRAGGNRLYPWRTPPIDVSGLAPGTYTFVASNDDPTGGEGGGVDSDTRTIIVE